MKGFMKACGIIAGICMLTGIVLVGLVVATKGTSLLGDALDNMEVTKIIRKIDTSFRTTSSTSGEVVDGKKMEHIENLVLNLGGCGFQMMESEDQYFYLSQSGTENVEIRMDGTTCYITFSETSISVKSAPQIRFYVPKGTVFQNADLKLGAGEFDIHNLQADNLTIEMGAGEVHIEKLDVANATVEIGVGSFTADLASVGSTLNVSCAMGSIDMTLQGSKEDYNINGDCAMGDISIAGRSLSSGQTGNVSASKTINAQCSMGSIDIRFE